MKNWPDTTARVVMLQKKTCLSFTIKTVLAQTFKKMVPRVGLEPTTYGLGIRRSVHLSYRSISQSPEHIQSGRQVSRKNLV